MSAWDRAGLGRVDWEMVLVLGGATLGGGLLGAALLVAAMVWT